MSTSVNSFGPASWIGHNGAQNTASGSFGNNGGAVNLTQTLPNGARRNTNAGLAFSSGILGLGRATSQANPDGSIDNQAGGLLVTPYGLLGARGSKHTTANGSYNAAGEFGLGAIVDGVGVGAVGKGTQTYNAYTGTETTRTDFKLGVLAPSTGVLGLSSQGQTVRRYDGSFDLQKQTLLGATNGTDTFGLQANLQQNGSSDGTIREHRDFGFKSTFTDDVLFSRDVTISPTGRITGKGEFLGIDYNINRQSLDPKYWLA